MYDESKKYECFTVPTKTISFILNKNYFTVFISNVIVYFSYK